jgi:hypothetical protein
VNLTSLFNIKGLAIAFGIGAAVAAVPTGLIVYKIMDGSIASLKLGYEKANNEGNKKIAATQKSQDKAALKGAIKTATNQEHEGAVAAVVTKEIISRVKDTVPCISYGLVRVLNHAASGDIVAPALAPGQPDDACAPITWRAFADDIADDYHIARLNASQLNDLIQTVKDIHDAKPEPAQ